MPVVECGGAGTTCVMILMTSYQSHEVMAALTLQYRLALGNPSDSAASRRGHRGMIRSESRTMHARSVVATLWQRRCTRFATELLFFSQ